MPVTNYYTIDGQIEGESTGGVRTNYLRDALGSVTATVDESGTIQNTYRYKPYGSLLAKTGVAANPKFLWNGVHGYRTDDSAGNQVYVRNRTYFTWQALWSSIDPLWPLEASYTYVGDNPSSFVDPSGTTRIDSSCLRCKGSAGFSLLNDYLDRFCSAIRTGGAKRRCIVNCASINNIHINVPCLDDFCTKGKPIKCVSDQECADTELKRCPTDPRCDCAGELKELPKWCGYAHCTGGDFDGENNDFIICCNQEQVSRDICKCEDTIYPPPVECDSGVNTMFHELGHICGPGCNSHPGVSQHDLKEFAKCVRRCLS